jgi:integrase
MASIKKFHAADCPGGTCGCIYRLDYRPLGLRGPRKRLFFATKKAAERHLSETVVKVDRGEYLELTKTPTFGEAAALWYETKKDRRAAYVADIRSTLDNHLLPRVGTLRLDKITVPLLEKMRTELRNKYAAPTVGNIIRVLGAVFRAAIRRGEANTNPVDRMERAFTAVREMNADEDGSDQAVTPDTILSPEEIRLLLDATTPGLYRTLFTTAALTGARSGELLALRWADIEMPDARPAYVYIRRTLSWARSAGEANRARYYPPKTRAGIRRIPISPDLVHSLKSWKLSSPPSQDDLVFATADGRPLRRSNALRYGLWGALRRAGLRRVSMHSLRHSFASALISGGAAVSEVQMLLGHSSPAVTLKIYSHWFKSQDSGAVARLSDLILKSEKSGQKVDKHTALESTQSANNA